MNLLLFDINELLTNEWERAFPAGSDDVTIMTAPLAEVMKERWEAIVSPANSFGIMDGGIDLHIRNAFPQLQANVTREVADRWKGFIPVGSTDYADTGDEDHPWCVIAPTMEWPMAIPGRIIYGISRGIFSTVEQANLYEADIDTVAIPGLGTATGRVSPKMCAEYMALAWEHHKQATAYSDWGSANRVIKEILKSASSVTT